ncbi:FAD-dependent oxidoreductase [Streptomyces sp. AJS327]|uniref:FAD-dependent oxidoreductase n=1 Tax=Streptomyces sp. AJS327 TaxID=2545265 RepID=UPI0015DE9DC5|nr:FAD-dependent oxidoreductase [Streptomyces sp. AJS327]
MNRVLVIGNGPAAHRLAERLAQLGHRGEVTLLGAEPTPACHRPLLTAVLAGRLSPQATHLPPPPGARVHLDTVALGIDRSRRHVRARRGGAVTTHPYDTLVLATGARPELPAIPGSVGPGGRLATGVTAVRDAADCERVTGRTAVVLGGGPLGVETASALADRSLATTLVCAEPHPLAAQLDGTCGDMLTARLRHAGVAVRTGTTVTHRAPGHVRLADGTHLDADTLVLCTGVTPETRLAQEAGLTVRDGITVDDQLRTSDPRVRAIGDCAAPGDRATRGIDAAREQAEVLAATLTGHPAHYRPAPPTLRLRTPAVDLCRLGEPADDHAPDLRTVTLTDRTRQRYARLTLRDDRVVTAVLLGVPRAIATIRSLHRSGRPLPSDRLGLLLDLPPRPAADETEPEGDVLVCRCNSVSERDLARAWDAGSRTVAALASTTRATTGCGNCHERVRALCSSWASESANRLGRAS